MDWGLLRTREKGKWGLRHKLMYPVWFYYFAAFTNLTLRFVWVIPLAFQLLIPSFSLSHLHVLLISIAELFRRAQWALLRIENENVNNFEKYRNIL